MNRLLRLLISFSPCLLVPLSPCQVHSQEYYEQNFVRNDNATYRANIQTVLLYKAGFELSPPIIQLNTDERLVLSFDDLDADRKNYRYTLQQCDAFWKPSQLQPMEYIQGFQEEDLEDYQISYNTTTRYMNYVLVFPTDYMKITKSGNYILKVFIGSPEDKNVVLTRRFMVWEPLVNVDIRINKAMDLYNRWTHQQVDLRIIAPDYNITDSYRDLHVFIMQNGRWDNMLQNVQPRSISGNVYDYTMQQDLSFPGGNEFRYLDMKTLKYNTDRMKSLQYDANGYQVYVNTDMPRNKGNYYSDKDIDGKRLISVNDARNNYTEADYAWVHFLLTWQTPIADGSLYVAGSFCDWQYTPINKMTYNFDLHAYEASILLKQGYYNYEYVYLQNRSIVGDPTYVEGSYWETENEYTVLVYHRTSGDQYDRLIGVGFANSGK